jgi:VWFA-related protein
MLTACAVAATRLVSQTPGQQATIRTTVPVVQVPTSVTDKSGHFVYGLTASDFLVSDEGRAVPIHVDDPDTVSAPLAVVLLVQTTDISDSALLKIKKVGSMIGGSVIGANGMGAVITYSDQIAVLQQLTSDEDALAAAFRNLKSAPTRNGHLVDAVQKAVELLQARPTGARSAIVILGESRDRGSKSGLAAILPALQNSGATVYCLEYSAFLTPLTTRASDYSPPEGGRGWILDTFTEAGHAIKKDTGKALTMSTGGRTFHFETKSALENDFIHLGADIHSRYMISFTPVAGSPSEPKFHHVTVQVKGHPDWQVRARPGYWP